MTLLTAKLRLVETFGAFGVTFAARQLPTIGTLDALITTWPAASMATEVAFGAGAAVAVIAISTGGATLAALQLQALSARRAIHTRHALRTSVKTFGTYARLHVETIVAAADTATGLQEETLGTGEAGGLGGTVAGLASGVAGMTMIVVIVFRFIAILTTGDNAFSLLVSRPILAAGQTKAITATCCTARWTSHTLLTLFIRIVTVQAAIQTFAIEGKTTGTTCDALGFGGTIASGTR